MSATPDEPTPVLKDDVFSVPFLELGARPAPRLQVASSNSTAGIFFPVTVRCAKVQGVSEHLSTCSFVAYIEILTRILGKYIRTVIGRREYHWIVTLTNA